MYSAARSEYNASRPGRGRFGNRGQQGAWGRGRGRGRGRGQGQSKDKEDIPKELIEPCKVYVSNLRRGVTERVLHEAFSHYAAVERAIIIKDKDSRKSKGYGFVKVKTPEDVEKLMNLRDGDRYIQGQEVIIKPAKKKISLPGDDEYVRRPLPDRDFDLSQPDPTEPTIHMLVDDVLFKILSYLPVKGLVKCERVCRRWQLLVHRQFSKMTNLEINFESLQISPPFTKSIISKLLILSGPNLKSLKVQRIDHATRQNILKIIGQLCPVLEHLDVTKARGINFIHISKLAAGCKHIKSFIAKNCIDFDEKALHQLLTSYPQLERLNVAGTAVCGKNFNLLPSTLKELSIEGIPDICHKLEITTIANLCPNMEVLDMTNCILSYKDLKYFGDSCPNLTKLTVFLPDEKSEVDCSEGFASFKKLTDLTVEGEYLELAQLISALPDLERLTVDSRNFDNEEVDFSPMKKLNYLKINNVLLTKDSMITLAKCPQLEDITLKKCGTVTQELLLDIIKGCPRMRRVNCPSAVLFTTFASSLNQIMKNRSGKILVEVNERWLCQEEVDYDRTKIEIDFIDSYSDLYDPFDYDSGESDYSDVLFDEDSWYDSDGSLQDFLFREHNFYDDPFGAALILAAWSGEDSDSY